ncbi:hypothetical protein ZWY2020_037373 [Hordeum vulgare]|nr:hypothetical protein ZWY2020_037373 [Hordeum vulgare]
MGERDLWKRWVTVVFFFLLTSKLNMRVGYKDPSTGQRINTDIFVVLGEHNEEVVGEDICYAEMENALFHTRDQLSVVLHQFTIEDNGCGHQPDFITQPIEQDVSDAEAHLHDNMEQKVMDYSFSSLDPIDQVCNHQISLDDTSISDVNKCSVGNELPLSSVSRSCDDHTDNNEYRYPEVVQVNTLESINHVEESSPINE